MDTTFESPAGEIITVETPSMPVSQFEMTTNIWYMHGLEHLVRSGRLPVTIYYIGIRTAHLHAFQIWKFIYEKCKPKTEYYQEIMAELETQYCPELVSALDISRRTHAVW